jgi:hypothetical protein
MATPIVICSMAVMQICPFPSHAQNGDSALAWAADHGHVDCVQALVSRMAPLDSKNKVRVVSFARQFDKCVLISCGLFMRSRALAFL